ncbi:MAG: formylglycine-generating enzyme family protein, partial [Kiritimatiellae bacterium]|nr:formylglycine-generating enzyme family protein [Kiritimatiellia bacterium]
ENVSWDDCQKFIGKVSAAARRQLGGEARLPTEAEWEYACRAGTAGPYGGTGHLNDMGWYYANSGGGTHPIGGKRPNACGFHDMHGNVCEWCQDWYGEYPSGDATDPQGPASGDGRVLRGGCWYVGARNCRSAFRRWDFPAYRSGGYGFRLCCSLSPLPKHQCQAP